MEYDNPRDEPAELSEFKLATFHDDDDDDVQSCCSQSLLKGDTLQPDMLPEFSPNLSTKRKEIPVYDLEKVMDAAAQIKTKKRLRYSRESDDGNFNTSSFSTSLNILR